MHCGTTIFSLRKSLLCMSIAMLGLASTIGDPVGAETLEIGKERVNYPLSVEGPEPEDITPLAPEEIRKSIARGVDFLLETQTPAGYWGRSANPKYYRIWAPVPGAHNAFRTATTGLCLEALVSARGLFQGDERDLIEKSIDDGQKWLLDEGSRLRRSEPDQYDDYFGYALYNVWGHSFAIHALHALHQRAKGDEQLQSSLKECVEYHVDRLQRDEFLDGGWGYYDHDNVAKPRLARFQQPTGSPSCFTTATALIALKKAQSLGFEFPQTKVDRAMASLRRQRYPDFAYAYGEYLRYSPRYGINRPAGSLGRSQVCNLAMRLYGDQNVTQEVLRTWLKRLIARNGWLSMSRKRHIPGQSPHFADFGVAGYFYYYGHYYAAMCMEQLPQSERSYYQDHLAFLIVPKQEKDGSWWDYILYDYHQQYGTAMAISTLMRCYQEP